jgi:hypothetical protein
MSRDVYVNLRNAQKKLITGGGCVGCSRDVCWELYSVSHQKQEGALHVTWNSGKGGRRFSREEFFLGGGVGYISFCRCMRIV